MQIREIHIDGFGVFTDKRISGLSPGLNVIYGPNEKGKSTLLEFVRRILFGFDTRKKSLNPYTPARGGTASGSLICELRNGDTITIRRTLGKGGKLQLLNSSGEAGDETTLESCLGHASQEVYQNIYAFSIEELQAFESLNMNGAKNRIHDAGLGMTAHSLADFQKLISESTDKLFKPRGKTHPMQEKLHQIRELESKIQTIRKEAGLYEELQLTMQELDAKQQQLKSARPTLEAQVRKLEMAHKLYPHYVALIHAQEELQNHKLLKPVPDNILQSFDTCKTEFQHLSDRLVEENETLANLKIKINSIRVPNKILDQEQEIIALREQREQIRSVIEDMPQVQQQTQYLEADIQQEAANIGPGWNPQRIENFQTSNVDKNQIASFNDDLTQANQEVKSTKDILQAYKTKKASEAGQGLNIPGWLRLFAPGLIVIGLIACGVGTYFSNIPFILISIGVAGLGFLLWLGLHKGEAFSPKEDPHENTLQENCRQANEQLKNIEQQWVDWLKEKELDPSYTPLQAGEVFSTLKHLSNRILELQRLRERYRQMQTTPSHAEEKLSILSAHCPDIKLPGDLVSSIDLLARELDQARKILGNQQAIDLQIKQQTETIKRLELARQDNRQNLKQFFKSVDVKDESEFQQLLEKQAKAKSLQDLIAEKQQLIQSQVGPGEAYDQFIEFLHTVQPEKIKSDHSENHMKLETLKEELEQLNQNIGQKRSEIKRIASDDDLLACQTEQEVIRLQINILARKWATQKLALAILKLAKRQYEQERQPAVIKSAEKIFSGITQEKYRKIFTSIDSDEIRIAKNSTDPGIGIMEMSRGTREQLYLAMRLGLIEEYENRAEALPMVMDDVFVNFDDQRREQTIQQLANFAASRQVILLTCHEHSLETYKKYGAKQVHF
jgi:uncharacterized protein YhaN